MPSAHKNILWVRKIRQYFMMPPCHCILCILPPNAIPICNISILFHTHNTNTHSNENFISFNMKMCMDDRTMYRRLLLSSASEMACKRRINRELLMCVNSDFNQEI